VFVTRKLKLVVVERPLDHARDGKVVRLLTGRRQIRMIPWPSLSYGFAVSVTRDWSSSHGKGVTRPCAPAGTPRLTANRKPAFTIAEGARPTLEA
jgi:hypothetical protein